MSHSVLFQLAGIFVLGILAQWTSWFIRLPSILLLLTAGILSGPVTGWLHPDALFGDLMLPMVSLSVAVILYEGGLNLKTQELKTVGGAFFLLTTIGAGVSWLVGTAAAYTILGLQLPVATLLGAILVVTGPTVIGPILRHLRLRGKVGALLKWEGIIIDPLGATLAVLVFTVIQAGPGQNGLSQAARVLGLTLGIGVVIGGLAAAMLIIVVARFWVPDRLHNPVSLMLMFAAFTASNALQDESGLLTVTVMGIVLANQKWVSIRHVVEFKETLTVLLISSLFIILSARLRLEVLRELGWESLAFVAVMLFVARPAGVLAATWRSTLSWQERAFLCCMAPRGIVAAAISSVFALSLLGAGFESAVAIVPVTFLVVFVTVLLYGVAAAPLAKWLGLTQTNPQGILFVGASPWTQALASVLKEEGCPVLLIDTDWAKISQCRMAGLPCLYGSALARATREEIDYTELGRMLAVTANNEANSLACLNYTEDFGRQGVYQLPFAKTKAGVHEGVSLEHRGRLLFDEECTFDRMELMLMNEAKVRKTKLTKEFDYLRFRVEHGETVVPLFVLKADGTVQICTVEGISEPKPGDVILSVFYGSRMDDLPAEASSAEGSVPKL